MATGVQIDVLASVLAAISKRLNSESFDTCSNPFPGVFSKDSSTLRLTVPNNVFRDWITSNYFDGLKSRSTSFTVGLPG